MKKIIRNDRDYLLILITYLFTATFLLLVFYSSMANAKATFGYTLDGKQIVSVDIGIQQFNYWEE